MVSARVGARQRQGRLVGCDFISLEWQSIMLISAIIIARNEEQALPRLLARLNQIPQVAQIILGDGGSTDGSVPLAQKAGAQIVSANGRGAQLNAGAGAATNEILWFLHADCLPARGCGAQIVRSIRRANIGGHLRIRFESRSKWARLFETVARVQARFGAFYGDSGIFCTRRAFDELNGFQNWPLFEDLDFARRLQRLGRIETLAGRLRVSARRFQKRPLHTLLLWLELQLRFNCGQSPEKLARLYRQRSLEAVERSRT